MNRFRKILALLLTIVLLLSLGGCGYTFKSNPPFFYNGRGWAIYHQDSAILPIADGVFYRGENAEAQLLESIKKSGNFPKDFCLPILQPPAGFKVKTVEYGTASGLPIDFPTDAVYSYRTITYGVHSSFCPLSKTIACSCHPFYVSFELDTLDIKKDGDNIYYFLGGHSAKTVLPALYTALTAEYVSPEILEAEGANVLSPFCLPMIPFRLLRILLKELVKAAFAFGIGWLFVLFAKRRKKSTPTK